MGFITVISSMVLLWTLFAVLFVPRGAVALCSIYFNLRERKRKSYGNKANKRRNSLEMKLVITA